MRNWLRKNKPLENQTLTHLVRITLAFAQLKHLVCGINSKTMTEKQRRKRIKKDLKGNLKSTAEKLGVSVSTVTRVLDYQIINSEYLPAIEAERDRLKKLDELYKRK